MGHTFEFIVWLIFSKYNFQKTVSNFPNLKIEFWKRLRECFQDTKNIFIDIVVNKLNIFVQTLLSFKFRSLSLSKKEFSQFKFETYH